MLNHFYSYCINRLLLLAWISCVVCDVPSVSAQGAHLLAHARLFQEIPAQQDVGSGKRMADVVAKHLRSKPVAWANDLAALRHLPVLTQLRVVQETINRRITYRDDPENIWLAPVEAYQNGGDCEDFAIAKLLLLRESGFPEKNLRVVTLEPISQKQVYHVILLALWQDKMYVLDSPGRTPGSQVVLLDVYKDAARPVAWVGWTGGMTGASRPIQSAWTRERDSIPATISLHSPLRMVSYRQYPAHEKLVRIAADLLIIHPWETPLTPAEVQRLRLLRRYFHEATPENAHPLTAYEVRKLDELRHMRKTL
ncbi:MAG: transglutaminase-like cysteine peptidase [Magnetococcus sp. YQC-5]